MDDQVSKGILMSTKKKASSDLETTIKTHIVSFSGGRTSAYLIYLIESLRRAGKFPGPVEYVYMDTGAEHPLTYTFIRQVVEDTGINLTCLQGDTLISPWGRDTKRLSYPFPR